MNRVLVIFFFFLCFGVVICRAESDSVLSPLAIVRDFYSFEEKIGPTGEDYRREFKTNHNFSANEIKEILAEVYQSIFCGQELRKWLDFLKNKDPLAPNVCFAPALFDTEDIGAKTVVFKNDSAALVRYDVEEKKIWLWPSKAAKNPELKELFNQYKVESCLGSKCNQDSIATAIAIFQKEAQETSFYKIVLKVRWAENFFLAKTSVGWRINKHETVCLGSDLNIVWRY
jgi:hypothetical protein